jgi:quinol monooxygenase YgiN
MKTRVLLRTIARPDTAEALKALLLELAEKSCNEDGCEAYKVFQSQTDPLEFTCYESWADNASVEKHMTMPHVARALEMGVPLLAQPLDRRVYTTVYTTVD